MKLLDLFCGAGGASEGYAQVGFNITGIDSNFQKHYPFKFIQANVLELSTTFLRQFDLIHASPPCQLFSSTMSLHKNNHPDLIESVRQILIKSEVPYVIENVVGAPLINPTVLCGTMFEGLNIIRHRLFETSWKLSKPPLCNHIKKTVKMGRAPTSNEYHSVVGHFSGVQAGRDAMGIQWMIGKELAQAVPPAYTKWIGENF